MELKHQPWCDTVIALPESCPCNCGTKEIVKQILEMFDKTLAEDDHDYATKIGELIEQLREMVK